MELFHGYRQRAAPYLGLEVSPPILGLMACGIVDTQNRHLPETPKMSLKLQTIRMCNFKSFRGTHEISHLDDHIVAIVGPNGSGKSNVIESILFVLGYKPRKMRHASLKDLITNGFSECFVELVFNQFIIKRTITSHARAETGAKENRDNQEKYNQDKNVDATAQDEKRGCISKYTLNDEAIPYQGLICFLRQQGIDIDNNRFLILQGEIENISLMPPLDLLNYIEDCVGTAAYKEQIEGVEQGICTKQEELDVAGNNLKFIETDYAYKKDKVEEKISYLKAKAESLILKGQIVDVKEEIARRKGEEHSAEKHRMEERLRELLDENKENHQKMKKLERESENLRMRDVEEELLASRREYQKTEHENKTRVRRREKLEKDAEKMKSVIEENIRKQRDWEAESSVCSRELEQNMIELSSLRKEIDEYSRRAASVKEIALYERRRQEGEEALLTLLAKKDKFMEQEAEISFLKLQLQELSEAPPEARPAQEKQALEKELSVLERDIKATEQEIHKRKRRAEDYRGIEEAYKREQAVYDALKDIKGVCGPLKNLGTMKMGYEAAVEAATKSLSSIVVERTAVAEECIEIINRKRLSRTTFIILDKLTADHKVDHRKPAQHSEKLLLSKIDCASKFLPAFYFAFRDTLVVDTLAEARVLAFGPTRNRVVTLDGQLLEKSGIMSGGRQAKKVKGASELEAILENMKTLHGDKRQQLQEILATERKVKEAENRRMRMAGTERELRQKTATFNPTEHANLQTEIERIKAANRQYEAANLPPPVRELLESLKLLNQKTEQLERANQELRIRLSPPGIENTTSIEEQLSAALNELGTLVFIEHDCTRLTELEEMYKQVSSSFRTIQDAISNIRATMGNAYHEEADIRNKLDESEESITECRRILRNCTEKREALKQEYKMVHTLLTNCDCVLETTELTPLDLLSSTEDASELKRLSKELMDALNQKEGENLRKMKASYEETTTMDDICLYRTMYAEYEDSKRKYECLKGTHDYLVNAVISLRQELERLKEERLLRFTEGFDSINGHMKNIFSEITFGGNAELELVDNLNPFQEGVILSVMPLRKAWKQVSQLSGGEKTLASISLIFALHRYKPSAFYVMDEIDAALDYKNVSVIAQYLKRIRSQFIIISLRDGMVETADTLVGIYKVEEASRSVVLQIGLIGDV